MTKKWYYAMKRRCAVGRLWRGYSKARGGRRLLKVITAGARTRTVSPCCAVVRTTADSRAGGGGGRALRARRGRGGVVSWISQLTRTDSSHYLSWFMRLDGGNDLRSRFARRARRARLLLASLAPCTFRLRVRRGRRAARHTPLTLECAGVPPLHQVKLRHPHTRCATKHGDSADSGRFVSCSCGRAAE